MNPKSVNVFLFLKYVLDDPKIIGIDSFGSFEFVIVSDVVSEDPSVLTSFLISVRSSVIIVIGSSFLSDFLIMLILSFNLFKDCDKSVSDLGKSECFSSFLDKLRKSCSCLSL